MKSLITLTAVLAAMLSVSAAADALPLDTSVKPAVTRLANPAPKTGLYVGNSFTYYNCGLVGYVRGFAKAAGPVARPADHDQLRPPLLSPDGAVSRAA